MYVFGTLSFRLVPPPGPCPPSSHLVPFVRLTRVHLPLPSRQKKAQEFIHLMNRKRARAEDAPADERDVVFILEKAGLVQGREGLVDAYDRAASTEIANESLADVRPDIVHQCLLALFDTDLAYRRRMKVYISTVRGKTIEVSAQLRPPRTFGRFKGLMSALLRDGQVRSAEGQVLMKVLPGSVAPVIPHEARVVGITNSSRVPVLTPTQLAKKARDAPIPNGLQGGIKNVAAFYCISCTDDQNLEGVSYLTEHACLSAYPASSHVMCARLCEGHQRFLPPIRREPTTPGDNDEERRPLTTTSKK